MKKLFILIFILVIFNNVHGSLLEHDWKNLDLIACKYGTDKGSWAHDYAKIYDSYFSNLRDKPINFLEIGFAGGASARMWQDYFNKAELYFMDINPQHFSANKHDFSSRCNFYVLDQADELALKKFVCEVDKPFDIILDDGGHTMEQQLTSFALLFPMVKSGGVYIIEDLHTSYWKQYGGGGTLAEPKSHKNTMISYLKELIDELNFLGAHTGYAGKNHWPAEIVDNLSYYQSHIESIHFYTSLCFVFKR